MKAKTLFVAATLLACLLALPLTVHAEGKDNIFIGRLHIQPSVFEQAEKAARSPELRMAAESLETQFIAALNSTRIFQIVERKRKADLELEQAYAQGGGVDLNDQQAARIGIMAGAKYAFLPQIDGFEDSSETVEHEAIGRQSLTRKIFMSAVLQIVDTTTGKLLPESPSVQLTREEELAVVRAGAAKESQKTLIALAREMAEKLCWEAVGLIRPARVLEVNGAHVMINRGSDAGFAAGAVVEFYAAKEVKDEETGEVFRYEAPVGQAKISRADKRQSFAMVEGENLGVSKGCVAKVVKPVDAQPSVTSSDLTPGDLTPGSGEAPLNWNK